MKMKVRVFLVLTALFLISTLPAAAQVNLPEEGDDLEASATSSFGSSGGQNYSASFQIVDVMTGQHTGDRTENVSVGENSVSFTGYVEVPTPCHRVEKTYEETDSDLVLRVDTYSTNKTCAQMIATKKYSFSLESNKDFRLEIRHNGAEVRTVETPEVHKDSAGTVAEIINFFQNLL